MILWLCYIFPPLAISAMGRPFMAFSCMFVMLGGWSKGVNMAHVCYADYKGTKLQQGLLGATNNPTWAQNRPAIETTREEPALIDDPTIGQNGTQFKKREPG